MPIARPAGPATDRLDVLDALRGFALFGILLANIAFFAGFGLMSGAQFVAAVGAETASWVNRFQHLLVDGKFYTLFSLLFGAGFALQLSRLSQAGHDGLRIYRRRVLVLLGIGLVHTFVIWDGDILVLYALLGFVLPLFNRLRDGWLLAWAALLVFVVPIAGAALFAAVGWAPHETVFGWSFAVSDAFGIDASPEAIVDWVRREDWQARVAWMLSGTAYSWALRIESWRIAKVLGIMVLGLWAGRRLAAGSLLPDRRLQWGVLVGGLAVGLPASFVFAWTPGLGQGSLASVLGTVPLALAYAAAFVLAWPRACGWLGVFVAPGRMALTNYLVQSVACTLVFYGVGLGLAGEVTIFQMYAFAVALFAVQCMVSRWWLARHAQGPMEALWRRWTYGRR